MRFASHLKKFAIIVLVLPGLSVLQAVYYYPRLPDTVASHFDLWGNPDGWMGKQTFCVLGPIMLLIVVAFVGGIGLVSTAVCASKASRSLAPGDTDNDDQQVRAEQKRKVQEFLAEVAGLFGLWFSFLMGAFLLTIMQLGFQANLRTPPILKPLIPVLIGYLLAFGLVGIWKGRQAMKLLPPRALPPGVWFPAKRFGWGWGLPVRWQGWVVMIVWLGILFVGLARIPDNPISVFLFFAVMIVVLLVLFWWKGERPRWRWGE